jgi:hypothetical protein
MDQHVKAVVESVANEWNVHAAQQSGLIVLAILPSVNRYRLRTCLCRAARLNRPETVGVIPV